MIITDIAIRRRGLSAITFTPAPPKIEGAEYEGERLLIDREIIARCHLKKEEELEVADLKELVLVSESFRAKQKAIWYLSGGDCSEKALFEKLCKSFSEKAAAFGVAQMVKRGYVDDYKYATRLAKKFREENRSKRDAAERLYLKGIPADLAKEVLLEQNYGEDEALRAAEIIRKSYINKIGDDESVKKTVMALQRKGFGFSDIKKALEIILNELEAKEIF